MAVAPSIHIRVLMAVGDGEPVEVGTIEQRARVRLDRAASGHPVARVQLDTRRNRRAIRKFFRAAARAS